MFNPWETTEDGQRRTITYTVSINHAIGPKHSPTTEQQVSFGKKKVHFLFRHFKIHYQPSGWWQERKSGSRRLDIQPNSRNLVRKNVLIRGDAPISDQTLEDAKAIVQFTLTELTEGTAFNRGLPSNLRCCAAMASWRDLREWMRR